MFVVLGPMSKQLGDFSAFWRMVWQQQVEKIVMVTNLMEGGVSIVDSFQVFIFTCNLL